MSLPIGTVTIAAAATPVAVAAAAMAVRALSLKARQDNDGPVYVGNAGVTAANGYCLSAGDEVTLQFGNAIDLRGLYVTGANAGGPRGLRRRGSVRPYPGGRTAPGRNARDDTALTRARGRLLQASPTFQLLEIRFSSEPANGRKGNALHS